MTSSISDLDFRVLQMLVKTLTEEVSYRSELLSNGTQQSFDGYRYEAGVIRGLRNALDAIDEVNKQYFRG